ncbi:MAG: hypothetical protein NUV73_03655 [Candidatus Daviesbacteria bacterium]|nr:hypothetical protein [Candidatus Daviesbacteria bacterium]
MTRPEVTSEIKERTFLEGESSRGKHRIASAFIKAITRLYRDQRGEEDGPGCAIVIAVGAAVVSLLILTANNNEQKTTINSLNNRVSALETAVAAIQAPTPTPTPISIELPTK